MFVKSTLKKDKNLLWWRLRKLHAYLGDRLSIVYPLAMVAAIEGKSHGKNSPR